MRQWPEKAIRDTLNTFGPLYLKEGKRLTREDAVEMINNMLALLEVLGKRMRNNVSGLSRGQVRL